MNILLVCAAGMSTSLLVNRMNDAAKAKGIELNIEAHPVGSIDSYGEQADVILLGPQVRYELKNVQKSYPDKPVEVIQMQDYGMMNGAKVLDRALQLLGK
ncbi:MAG: PTS sugar transporter subunit IIB [Coprobacillus sp.]|jgi:PTS system cellobiose-specific IIB component|nr:PTS sugar transporter subunit IIB [Coprobacillus sp.]MCI9094470.1 PTS sugar transporter subunit IIB [Coprobacillus sp.]